MAENMNNMKVVFGSHSSSASLIMFRHKSEIKHLDQLVPVVHRQHPT